MTTTQAVTATAETFLTVRAAVEAFVNYRASLSTGPDQTFTGEQLLGYVDSTVLGSVLPAVSTITRALRVLRQNGKVNYIVLSKNKQLYRATQVKVAAPLYLDLLVGGDIVVG